MATHPASSTLPTRERDLGLTRVGTYRRLRALAWDRQLLYASCGYALLRADASATQIRWEKVAQYRPAAWRGLSSQFSLSSRLVRDGFHALAALSTGHLIAAVPGAIATLDPGQSEFCTTHAVLRGTRPLHISVTPDDHVFWGEYFDNPERDEVHIYASSDHGGSWQVAYTFPRGAIRHVHNIVYDKWENCLWVLTGDNGAECRVLRASCDFAKVETVLSGNQQARAVALVAAEDGLYFSSDTPFEANHIYRLDRQGELSELATLSSSSIYGCSVGKALFFSTMVEPSAVNPSREVGLYGSADGVAWQRIQSWTKDVWPVGLFQYGNAHLPDGLNTSDLLAVSTIATTEDDLSTSLWRVNPPELR